MYSYIEFYFSYIILIALSHIKSNFKQVLSFNSQFLNVHVALHRGDRARINEHCFSRQRQI